MQLRKKKFIYALLLLASTIASLLCFFFLINPSADFSTVEFHDEYKDWKAADERYVGKSISIHGNVRSIHHGGGMMLPHGWTSVTIGEGPKGVICHFPPDLVYQTECFDLGHVVVIHGICKGEFGGWPILSNCSVAGMDLPQTVANLWTR